MIITHKDNTIYLRWRDENGNRLEKEVTDFRPYFYVNSDERMPQAYNIRVTNSQGRKMKLPQEFVYERTNHVNLEKQPLTKVMVTKYNDIRTARKYFDKTYEADVSFTHRYCIDGMTEIPEYDLRKWYWDMEWMTTGEYDGAITTIAVYDNYADCINLYYWQPHNGYIASLGDCYDSEKEMLEAFVSDMEEQDPDMLIAWFGLQADIPKLFERLEENNIDISRLSPIGLVKPSKKAWNQISPISQPIYGRLCLNLDHAFERQWNDAQRGTLPSTALDFVGNLLFGEGKKKESKFTDKNEFFRRAWLEDTENYLEYCMQDVVLLKRIDDENAISESILALQRLLVAPFDACFYASHMGGIYFMRHADWKVPTGDKDAERVEVTGAMVFDPEVNKTHGRHDNVAAFDFAQLYASMMVARNISWETKSRTPTEFACNLATPQDFSPVIKKDMRYYKTDKLGLLPRSVLNLKKLRDEYKSKMKKTDSKEEYQKWFNNQMAVKRLMASFYGVTAFPKFGWYDPDLANSITASAREAIRHAAKVVEEL